MLVLVQLLMMMMMMKMMKSEAASEKITVTAQSGDPVLLSSDQLKTRTEDRWDFRWTQLHLMLSLKNNVTTCPHGRCSLLRDGSLSFTTVQPEDAGNYSLEVFDRNGTRRRRTHFLLRVEVKSSHNMWLWICCPLLVLLPLVFIILFVLRKRSQRTTTRTVANQRLLLRHTHKSTCGFHSVTCILIITRSRSQGGKRLYAYAQLPWQQEDIWQAGGRGGVSLCSLSSCWFHENVDFPAEVSGCRRRLRVTTNQSSPGHHQSLYSEASTEAYQIRNPSSDKFPSSVEYLKAPF